MLGVSAALGVAIQLNLSGTAGEDPLFTEYVHRMSTEAYVVRAYWTAALFSVVMAASVLTFADRKRRGLWRGLVYVGSLALFTWLAVRP